MSPEVEENKPNGFIQALNTQRDFLWERELANIQADPRVIEAMKEVRREKFLPIDLQPFAYQNSPLRFKVGKIETVLSQPEVVLVMTELLEVQPEHYVLEVGTKVGYQAAVLSKLSSRVTTIEASQELNDLSRVNLDKSDVEGIETMVGDGTIPLSRRKFDRIIVTASMPPNEEIPLLKSLKEGGVAVIPIGGVDGEVKKCDLVKLTKKEGKIYLVKRVRDFEFLPSTGEYGWDSSTTSGFIKKNNEEFYDKIPKLSND